MALRKSKQRGGTPGQRQLRIGEPGLFGRVDGERVLLDLRTVLPEDDDRVMRAVQEAAGADVPMAGVT